MKRKAKERGRGGHQHGHGRRLDAGSRGKDPGPASGTAGSNGPDETSSHTDSGEEVKLIM